MTVLKAPAPRTAVLRRVPRLEPRPPRKPRRYFAWLAGVVLIAAVAGLLQYRDQIAARLQPNPAAGIRAVAVRTGTLEQTLRLTGTTVAERSVHLRAPYLRGRRSGSSGSFELVLADLAAPGIWVKQNDPVATFDRLSMRNRLDDYRTDRIERELGLRTLDADLDVKRAAYRQQVRVAKARMDKAVLDLKTAPVRSAIQVELFELAFDEAKAAYEALLAQAKYVEAGYAADRRLAELELREAQVEERRAEANVDRMVVRAPVDGLVVVTEKFRGAEFTPIQAGDQLRSGQPFAQIVDPRDMVVEATANQVDVEQIRIGARAYVRFDAYPNLELPARVYSIGPLATGRRWRLNYVAEIPVFLKLEGADPRLIPNLSVSADVILGRESSPGIVSRDAVFEDAGQPVAYVQTPNGWEKRRLQLGLSTHVDVAVHAGLHPGEVVAVEEPSG